MAVTTTASLVELIEKSKLLTAEQSAKAREMAAGTDDPRELARALVSEGVLTRWQAGQLLAGRSSFFLGKYKLIELLGRGGMGSVFLAQHTTMNRPVALKIISKQFGRDPAALERFLTEARAIAALDHPNIVHAYSVDGEGDRYFMAMEHVEGQNLQQMVEAEGPLDCRRAADYIHQAALGLAHAHCRNMIHCDVKPANLLVNRQGVVKILDLGMARLVGREADSAAAGHDPRVLGTVDYLAPEQALPGPQLDHRADLYSLGCTFYFLLTGHPPFPEGTLPERILKHQTQEPRPIADERPDVPQDLVEICRKMMAKDPEQRYQTADEVAEALARWQPPEESGEKTPARESALPVVVDPAASSVVRIRSRPQGPGQWARLVEAGRGLYRERPRVVLFSALGAAAGAVLIAGAIVFLMSSGDDQAGSVAAQVAPAAPAAGAPGEPPAEAGSRRAADSDRWPEVATPDLEFDPTAVGEAFVPAGGRGKSDAAKKKAASTPSDGEGPEADSPAAKPAAKKPAPVEPPQEEPVEEKPAAKAADGEPSQQSADSEPSQQSADAQQASKEEPTEGLPGDTAPQEEPPQEPVDDDESPEAEGGMPAGDEGDQPAPEKKPQPAPAAKKGPFEGFPETVDLPEFGGGESAPMEVGTVRSSADASWQLLLLGGDRALKSTRQMERKFVISRGGSDAAETAWAVQLAETSADGAASTSGVAIFRRTGQTLGFEWDAEADPASANYLRNCVLQIRVGGESHYVSFVRPVEVEPLTIDLARGLATVNADVKWLPESSHLRAAITKVEGREGHRVEPAEPAEPGPPVGLFFDRVDRHGNTRDRVEFRVLFTTRSSGLNVKLQLVEPPSVQFRALQQQNLTVFKNMIDTKQNEVLKQLNPKDKDKAPKGELRSTLNRQLDEMEKMLWYIEFFEQVDQQAKVYFDLWTEVDGRKLVLAATVPPQAD